MAGGTCVIRERFSAREFWPDIVRHECTMFVYIGELCRYLLDTPPSPAERRASASGSASATACARTSGGRSATASACAASSSSMPRPKAIARCSTSIRTPEAVGRMPPGPSGGFRSGSSISMSRPRSRCADADGRCIECAPGEAGEAIGEILDDPARPAIASKAMRTRPPPSARSCATCSSPATPGSGPAT